MNTTAKKENGCPRPRIEERHRAEGYAVGGWRSALLEVGGTRLRQGYGAARRSEIRRQRTKDRDSPVGAAFSRDSNDFFDLPLTAYRLLFDSLIAK